MAPLLHIYRQTRYSNDTHRKAVPGLSFLLDDEHFATASDNITMGTRCICRGRMHYLLNSLKVVQQVLSRQLCFFSTDNNKYNNWFVCPLVWLHGTLYKGYQ
jgi:hypothetical protein